MALAKTNALSLNGLSALPVEVEVDIRAGLPAFNIVGLGDKAIEESKERIKSAITNSGFQFPTKKVVINLAPAHIKKEGSWFDLSIALGILLASGQIPPDSLKNKIILGELALDGVIRFSPGIIVAASVAKEKGFNLIVPVDNYYEASLVQGLEIMSASNLFDLVIYLRGEKNLEIPQKKSGREGKKNSNVDIGDIKGQAQAKRALIIALSGGHNLLMYGPPGTGKSLLAKAAISLMPELGYNQALEVTKIYSLIGQLDINNPLINTAPYRNPHHSSSHVSLLGGGANPLPGEITLAHEGVLFLDELPEFSRQALEGLRQPLEDRKISIARAKAHLDYPANFILIGAMNPCPCGYYGDDKRTCSCTMGQIQQYRKKISGPILDRFDIFVKLPRLHQDELTGIKDDFSLEKSRNTINLARQKQYQARNVLNSELSLKVLDQNMEISDSAKKLLLQAMEKFNLSPRSYHKLLKVSRTLADLKNKSEISPSEIAEALQFRSPSELNF